MKKKALSLLLALAMCLSLLPTAALAEEAQMPEQEPAPIPAQEEEQDAPEDPKEKYGIGLFSVEDGHDDSHPICGANCSDSAHMLPAGKTWQPIKTASELRNAAGGYYYLANDISLAGSTGITAWSPKDGVVLCLNGKSITVENGQQPTINVGVLDSSAPINFTLTDCHARSEQGKITRAASGVGPGVQVLPNSIFTMYGGSLVDNGCGVSLTGGTFNMYGGTISNSTVYGGVRATYSMNHQTNAYAGGIFNMYDGSITGNTSNYGGGVFVDSDSSRSVAAAFYMYGGSIMGNSANTLGYGTGGGVYVNAGATFEVSGDVTITGNTKDGAKNNVYLPNGAAMTVGALDADASIGVTMAERATVTGVTSGSISNLTSDDDQYTFELDSKGNLVQKEKPAAHAHYLCGGSTCTGAGHTKEESTTTFTEWKSADSLPTEAGSYYLTTNVTLKQSWSPTENITLCLNGKTITAEDSFDAVQVAAGRSFTLTDCHTGEAQGTITHAENKTGRGVYVAGGTFHLYGGAISGNKVAGNGGGVCVGATGAFTMYGCMISVNTATYNSREWSGGNGGGVCVGANGAFTMYGGTISGNKATYNSRASSATGSGGGVCMLWGNDDDPGTFTMSGGSITKNEALNGGGLYAAAKSTFTMSGSSAISENTAASDDDDDGHGGGVYMRGSFTMSGSSTISGNKATNDGAGVFVAGSYNETTGASFIMNSGTVSNNEVTSSSGSGGGVFVGGNNIKNGSFTLNDGTISGNKASYGGGVYAYSSFTMNNGTISGNMTSRDGSRGAQGAADGQLLGLFVDGVAEIAGLGAQGDPAVRPLGSAGGTLTGTAGTLLTTGLAAAAGDLGTGQGALGTLALVGQVALHIGVHDGGVGLDAEDTVVQLDLADDLAGHIYYVHFRHCDSSSPLASGRGLLRVASGSLLRVLADAGIALGDLDVLHGVLEEDQGALGAGDGTADGDHVGLGVHLDDLEVLDRDLLGAQVTGHLLAGHDAGGVGVGAHGAHAAVDRADAVAVALDMSVPALDHAGVALALAGTDDVDLVAGGKDVRLDDVADVHFGGLLQTELLQILLGGDAGLFKVALHGLVDLPLGQVLKAQLDGSVAVVFHSFLLHHGAGAGFDDGDRDHVALFVKDLGHADFFPDDCFLHVISSLQLVVGQ